MYPKIMNIRPAPGGAGVRTIAHYDAEISEHCRLYGLLLREFPDGTRRTIAPNNNGRHFATFHPTIGEQLTAAASAALRGLNTNVHSR
jgi:hypothetical protein